MKERKKNEHLKFAYSKEKDRRISAQENIKIGSTPTKVFEIPKHSDSLKIEKDKHIFIVLEEKEHVKLSLTNDLSRNTDFAWSSDDNQVATVTPMGIVNAVFIGLTKIFARRTYRNFEEYVRVKVVKQGEADYRLAVHLRILEEVQLEMPNNKAVVWSSMDPEKAVVSQTGLVTAKSDGLVLITATTEHETKVIYVRVKDYEETSPDKKITKISVSTNYSFALLENGQSLAWGLNENGEFGINNTDNSNVLIKAFKNIPNISNMVAGNTHAFALTEYGELWAAGKNNYGQLGNNSLINSGDPVKILDSIRAVATRGDHSLAIKQNGELWAWGYNNYYQIGNGNNTTQRLPVKILTDVSAVSTGASHSMALKMNGELWAWGLNNYYQVGNSSSYTATSPLKILSDVAAISAGPNFSFALKTNGELWAWGYNDYGHLGNGTTSTISVPTKVMNSVKAVSAGVTHTLALDEKDQLWAWGNNAQGQLGNDTTMNNQIPTLIMDNIASISAGNVHSLALSTFGKMWIWGNNGAGLLGNGTNISSLKPIRITIPTKY